MNLFNQKNILPDNHIQAIKNDIKKLKEDININDPIPKDYILTLLSNVSKVLYYPIEDNVCSFYVKKNINSQTVNFVFINTNIPYEKQIYAAAHELAHILDVAKCTQDILTYDSFYFEPTDSKIELNDKIAERFASEFLVSDDILEMELKKIGMNELDSITLEGIIILMDKFIFPYKKLVIKLYTLHKLSNIKFKNLFFLDNQELLKTQHALNLCQENNKVTKDKKFADFMNLTIQSYYKTIRTYDKLEYLLKLFDLDPERLNVKKKHTNYLSEKEFELQRIFEEEL